MENAREEEHLKIVRLVQMGMEAVPTGKVKTPEVIADKLDEILTNVVPHIIPNFEIKSHREQILAELIRREATTVGRSSTLASRQGHIDWLNAARKVDWRYWRRYATWLESKMPLKVVDGIDDATDDILKQLEDPKRADAWDRRGLVVGHVQSGKTGNYTGLICKAADAGYKIIIVLAGLHNNLRSQTQLRLDEGFLGFATIPNVDEKPVIGVGEIDRDQAIRPNFATNRSENGDFGAMASRTFGIAPEERPWLFVVKKNKTVLERLLYWINNHAWDAQDAETGRKLVTKLPLLVIDDEADHGSVDTGEQAYNDSGQPDPEYEPKTINGLIRSILHSFTRTAYVGYTATPFANIFIHEQNNTPEHGPDLFPEAFIVNLAAPSNYVGPAKVFGYGNERAEDLPLIRELREEEYAPWMRQGHKNGYIPKYEGETRLPPSLEEAVRSFVLACAVRKLRDQYHKHSSMLVHVSRFTNVQEEVTKQIAEYVRRMLQRFQRKIDLAELEETFRLQWTNHFAPASRKIHETFPSLAPLAEHSWSDVCAVLLEVLSDISVRQINGTAKDALDYADNDNTGLKVIAIGGDKLARGLTLEGLCTSYFLRTAKMYDTLMQMGRWFGYRDGYLDLCRLYTTGELIEWFGHIANASEEMRGEFDQMVAVGATPRYYGLKVQSHSVMTVTSPSKMRASKKLMLSFSGELLQTVVFPNNFTEIERNFRAGESFIKALGTPFPLSEQRRKVAGQSWHGHLWRRVSHSTVAGFLREYQTHKASFRVVSSVVAQFIDAMAQDGKLTEWTVALVGKEGDENVEPNYFGDLPIELLKRSRNGTHEDRYSIKTLMSPRDEQVDIAPAQWEAAFQKTLATWQGDSGRNQDKGPPNEPSGPAIRYVRGFGPDAEPQTGLLLLYLLDPASSGVDAIRNSKPVLGWAVSFPASDSGTRVPYQVTNLLWTQINGWDD
jgi:hypothetical protein